MSQGESAEPTYTKSWDIATWHYIVETNPVGIDLYNPSERAPWLAKVISCALDAVSGFAQINSIDVTSDSEGEHCFSIKFVTPGDLIRLDSFLRSTLDVAEVHALLSLCCIRLNDDGLPEEFFIHNKGWLSFINNISKYGSETDGLLRVSFNFESDIYSPIATGDNRTLAALNSPRLRKFLHRLEGIPSLKLDEIDDPAGYIERAKRYGVVDQYGFKMPDDPRAFEEMLKSESAT